MLSQWMIVCIAFFASFVLTSFLFSKLENFEIFRLRNFSATASVVLGCVVSSVGVLSFYWDNYDFVSDIGLKGFLAPVIGLAAVFITCLINRRYLVELGVLIASFIGVFAGDLFIEFIPSVPDIVNKLCTVVVWFLFSIGIKVVAALYPFLQMQGITISGGIVLLYIFGVAPFMMGVVGATLLAAMMVAYMNYTNQTMGLTVSPIVGYLIGWFGLVSYNEMLMPCFIILTMVCLVEMSVSLLKKLTFMKKYRDFTNNSFLMQIYESGLAPFAMIKALWLLSGVLVVFCVFQANGVNSYSIPVFVFVVVLWQFFKLIGWKNEDKSWKETNKEVISQIKTVVNEIRKSAKSTKKVNGVKKTKQVKQRKTSKIKKGQK